jgi:hypothetical protein
MGDTADSPDREALQLSESVELAIDESASAVFDSQKAVKLHVIRPGVGKGRGRHLYEASMLAKNAPKFSGWRMYVDHLSPEARKAAGGLPRSVRDYGGRILESWWDPNVPADPKRGYGRGAVVARARPARWIRELLEDDPGAIECSISAQATAVHPVSHNGMRVWAVEGIEDRGSVDWVSEAGAGGRIAPMIEAAYESEEAVEMELLESMTDEELVEHLRETRPGIELVEAGRKQAAAEAEGMDADGDADGDEMDDEAQGKAKKNTKTEESAEEGDMDITPEKLQEALLSSPELLAEAVQGSDTVQALIDERVRTALAEEKAVSDAERDAVIDRQWELRDLRDQAHQMIAESRLPESWQDGLRRRFDLRTDRTPTPELDVVDEIDAEGQTVKPAAEVLAEAVTEALKSERRRLAEVAPTRVRGQGPTSLKEGEEEGEESPPLDGFHRQLLQEAGVDYDKAYAGI